MKKQTTQKRLCLINYNHKKNFYLNVFIGRIPYWEWTVPHQHRQGSSILPPATDERSFINKITFNIL